MKEIYVLAIGGSGARILRSLVMLLAAGVELTEKENEQVKLIPIIIDPDEGAGNLTETTKLLKLYSQIRAAAVAGNVEALTTFSTQIEDITDADYKVKLDNIAGGSFRDDLDLGVGMSEESRALMSSLFSKDNLDLDMTVGFKGNPNIGSIVLGQFESSQTYQTFMKSLQDGDTSEKSIFIISSIFGGTGASGFPTLLKSLRSSQTVVKDMRIGALSLLPYFALKSNPDSAIDSAAFYAKTRAALSYYKENILNNNNIDDFYLIGDKAPNTYDNSDGGQRQRNKAHFVELAGALSIVHFARQGAMRPNPAVAQMYEYGLSKPEALGFKALGDKTERDLAIPLTSLYLMHRFLENSDVAKDQDPWLKSIQPNLDGGFVDDLFDFLGEYEKWLGELSEHTSRGFTPLKLDQSVEDLFNCVSDYPIEKKGFFGSLIPGKKNIALYRDRLNRLAKEQGEPTTEGEFLNLFSDASYLLCESEIKLPSKH